MQVAETKTTTAAQNQIKAKRPPFFNEKGEGRFFSKSNDSISPFFGPATIQLKAGSLNTIATPQIQKKCAACEEEDKMIQRQEQPDPPETKPVSPDDAVPVPLRGKPRATKCSMDPRFPDFGCFGRELKLDIDENLFNNAHQFSRVATLFPGDNELMLDTFLRYGVGKNLLETGFGFAGFGKKWSSRLSYGTGIALKTYDLLQNGQLKLDVQLPIGKGVNFDIKLDINTNPKDRAGEESFNTAIGISGRF